MFLSPLRLFILFCFWASLLVASASPITVDTTQLERHTGTETAPVELWISHRGSNEEHWALVINTVHAFDVFIPDLYHQNDHPLKAREFAYDKLKKANLLTLDCTATFKSEAEKQEIFKRLVNIKLNKLPREAEGTCMDYVKLALTYLKEKRIISKIPPKFEELWKSDYDKVQKKVWGH